MNCYSSFAVVEQKQLQTIVSKWVWLLSSKTLFLTSGRSNFTRGLEKNVFSYWTWSVKVCLLTVLYKYHHSFLSLWSVTKRCVNIFRYDCGFVTCYKPVSCFTYLEAYRLGMTASCFLHLRIAHLLLGFSIFNVYFIWS